MQATIVQTALLSFNSDYKTPQKCYQAALKKLAFLGLTDVSEVTATYSTRADARIAETAGSIDELLKMISNSDLVNMEKMKNYICNPDANDWLDAVHIRFMANTSPESPIGRQQVIISLIPPYWSWLSVENGFLSKLERRIGIDKRKKYVPSDFLGMKIKCHYTSGEEAVKGLYGLQQQPHGLLRLNEELLLHDFPEEVSQTWLRLGGYINFHSASEGDYTNFQELNAQIAKSKLQTVSITKIILGEVEKLGITPESVGELINDKWDCRNGGRIKGFEQLIHATEYFNHVPVFSARYAGAQPPGSEIILQTALGSQNLKIDGIIDVRNGLVTVTSQAENQQHRIRTLAALLDECNQRLLQTGTAAYKQ